MISVWYTDVRTTKKRKRGHIMGGKGPGRQHRKEREREKTAEKDRREREKREDGRRDR